MKKAILLALVLGGAGAFWAVTHKPEDIVTGRSGHQWRVVLMGNVGGVKTYEVFAPKNSWGPHGELSVVRYSQAGSDIGRRYIRGAAVGVPPEMFAGAVLDFGLIPPPALPSGSPLPLGGSSGPLP